MHFAFILDLLFELDSQFKTRVLLTTTTEDQFWPGYYICWILLTQNVASMLILIYHNVTQGSQLTKGVVVKSNPFDFRCVWLKLLNQSSL